MSKDLVTPEGSEPANPTIEMTPNDFHAITNYLTGRLCTVVDATSSDQQQKSAIKDLVKHELRAVCNRLITHTFDNRDGKNYPFPY